MTWKPSAEDREWLRTYETTAGALGADLVQRGLRLQALHQALEEDGRGAEELFGPADEVARADVEDSRLSETEIPEEHRLPTTVAGWISLAGRSLLGISVLPALILLFVGPDPLRITVSHAMVLTALGLGAVCFGNAFQAVGAGRVRFAWTWGALTLVAVVGFVCLAALDGNRTTVLVERLPRWVGALSLMAPGIVALVLGALPRWWDAAARRRAERSASGLAGPGGVEATEAEAGPRPEPAPPGREGIGSTEPETEAHAAEAQRLWLRRYDEALQSRLVPAQTRKEAVAEAASTLQLAHSAPTQALGDPVLLATKLAAVTPASVRRRARIKSAALILVPFCFGLGIVLIGPLGWRDGILGVIALILTISGVVRWRQAGQVNRAEPLP